jgi:ribulose kinase
MLGAVGIGAHDDLPAAIRAMTRVERELEPDPAHRETYDRAFAAYAALWPAVAPVMRPLATWGAS